ncbi:hypothetical protein [Longitalea arenae]|uniref:hypothetical protein n=1 Tax=Longitalea arenae TaxID=2812558 RepID=UPI001967D4B3|nr:hypothetical protein [Longitalea arenae]
MSDIVIVLLLLVPILIVVIILNNANKKRKRSAQKKINACIAEATRQTGISNYFRKQLLHQTVIIDEKQKKLLIVEHNDVFSFDVFPIDAITGNEVMNQKMTFTPEGKGQRTEHITTRIGVELRFKKTADTKFLTLYDHHEHNIYLMADLEKEAHQLRDKIEKASNGIQ